jgi:hypothetical protein
LQKTGSAGRKAKNAEEIDFENWWEIAAGATEAAPPGAGTLPQ